MGGKGRGIRWRGEGNYRGRNHRGSNVAIINQPFLRDNVFGVGLKPRIPLTPLAWRFANFLEFLYIIDDENIRGVIAPTTSFHPWMKLVSFLFFIIIISFFPKKRKTIRTFPPLWRFFHAEVSLSSFLRERGKYTRRRKRKGRNVWKLWTSRKPKRSFISMRFLFSTGTVFPARRGSTSVYVGTWLAKQRVYKHRWHRSPLRGVLLLIEKRCPAPNVTMFLPPSTGRATIIALRIDRSSPRVLLIARWPLRAERILRASHNDSHKIRNSRENCIESFLVNYFNCVDWGEIYLFFSFSRSRKREESVA